MGNSAFASPGVKPAGQIWLSAAGMWPSTTAGAAAAALVEMGTNKQNVYTLDFADAATKYAEGSLAMPSDWDAGTITAKFYWMASDATTNAAVWGIAARGYSDGDALDQAWGTAVTVTDANASTAEQVRISAATAAVTVGGTPAAGQLVQFRVERVGADGSDSLTVAAQLLGVMISYTRT